MKKSLLPAVVLSLLPLAGCDDSSTPRGSSQAKSSDYLSQTANASRQAQKAVDVAAINKAVEKFYVQEGRFPTNLMELAMHDYIPMIPILPMGLRWDYDTNSGTVSIIKEAVKE